METSEEFNMIDSYYDAIAVANGGYLDSIKVTNLANAQGKGEAYTLAITITYTGMQATITFSAG